MAALGAAEGESDLARTLSLPLANVAALVEENLALRTHVETLKRSLQLKQKGPSTHASVLREVVRLRKEMGESGVRLKSVEHENKLLRVAFQTRLKDLSGERDALKNLHERNADAATQLAIEVAGLKRQLEAHMQRTVTTRSRGGSRERDTLVPDPLPSPPPPSRVQRRSSSLPTRASGGAELLSLREEGAEAAAAVNVNIAADTLPLRRPSSLPSPGRGAAAILPALASPAPAPAAPGAEAAPKTPPPPPAASPPAAEMHPFFRTHVPRSISVVSHASFTTAAEAAEEAPPGPVAPPPPNLLSRVAAAAAEFGGRLKARLASPPQRPPPMAEEAEAAEAEAAEAEAAELARKPSAAGVIAIEPPGDAERAAAWAGAAVESPAAAAAASTPLAPATRPLDDAEADSGYSSDGYGSDSQWALPSDSPDLPVPPRAARRNSSTVQSLALPPPPPPIQPTPTFESAPGPPVAAFVFAPGAPAREAAPPETPAGGRSTRGRSFTLSAASAGPGRPRPYYKEQSLVTKMRRLPKVGESGGGGSAIKAPATSSKASGGSRPRRFSLGSE